MKLKSKVSLLLLLTCTIVSAQNLKIIKGTVKGQDGIPISGVKIIIKETGEKRLTDEKGNFEYEP